MRNELDALGIKKAIKKTSGCVASGGGREQIICDDLKMGVSKQSSKALVPLSLL